MSKIYNSFDEWQEYLSKAFLTKVDVRATWDARQPEIEQLKARLVSFESRYTCFTCSIADSCKCAYDNYNTNGDCLAGK